VCALGESAPVAAAVVGKSRTTPAARVRRRGLPVWAAVIVTVLVVAGVAAGVYYLKPSSRAERAANTEKDSSLPTAVASPSTDPARGYEKVVEISGIRIFEEQKKPKIRLMVINHAATELVALEGTIRVTSGKGEVVAEVPLKLPLIEAYEAKEIISPFASKLRAYELPDWQFLRAEFKLK